MGPSLGHPLDVTVSSPGSRPAATQHVHGRIRGSAAGLTSAFRTACQETAGSLCFRETMLSSLPHICTENES